MHASYPEICAFCGQNPPLKAYTVNRINLPIPKMRPQRLLLLLGELEHEVGGETASVAAHLLVEALGGDAIERSEVLIEQHSVAAQDEDRAGDIPERWDRQTALRNAHF